MLQEKRMIPIDRKRCFIYQPIRILSRKPGLARKTTTINRAKIKKNHRPKRAVEKTINNLKSRLFIL